MTYNRTHLIPLIIQQLKHMTVGCDIVVWNNGQNSITYEGVDYFTGINRQGMIQRFLPSLIYPHKYAMFVDDDVLLGQKFLENAINIIDKQPEAVITTIGSIMDYPINDFNVQRRQSIFGKNLKNKDNVHLDIGCLGCAVMLRKHVHAVFRSAIVPQFFSEDILFYMSHQVYNNGTVILPRHDVPDYMGIRRFRKEHNSGLVANPAFYIKRNESFLSIAETIGWRPLAKTYPEWKS